jgi:fibronectin-binding autotransporter adhesin
VRGPGMGNRTVKNDRESTMQGNHRVAHRRAEVLSARSMLALAVSDVLASRRRTAIAPRRRDTQAALVLATAVVLSIASIPARAQDATWTGTKSDYWFDPFNWSNLSLPTGDTDVVIDITQPHSPVIGTRDAVVNTIRVGGSGAGMLAISYGGTLTSNSGDIGSQSSESIVTVTGTGSAWTNSGDLLVGNAGTGTLKILDGGFVQSALGSIGSSAGSVGAVMVSGVDSAGASSLWENGNLFVGDSGEGRLDITDGGAVVSSGLGTIGRSGGEGTVEVTGPDSRWTIGNTLRLGHLGPGTGRLSILDGGLVETRYRAVVADSPGSTGVVRVEGGGSALAVEDILYIGNSGSGTLDVLTGGRVESRSGYIGAEAGSSGIVTIGGADSSGNSSSWVNSEALHIGEKGSGQLTIQDGGTVGNATGTLGQGVDSTGEALVTGAGSSWTSSLNLHVGFEGTGTLAVQDGGVVNSRQGFIGNRAGSQGDATVAGTGSNWDVWGQLVVGNLGAGTLGIQGGAAVNTGQIFIGKESGSQGEATVTGTGSSWTSLDGLVVGNAGNGTLLVEAGGTASDQGGSIGNEVGSVGKATVTGDGSAWTNDRDLLVGNAGSGTLEILDGGVVSNTDSVIGNGVDATGVVLVEGADASWINGGDLSIGREGTGALAIRGGGSVSSARGFIGNAAGSTGEVAVEGVGSSWSNAGNLWVGNAGTGTLLVEAGGTVTNQQGFIGNEAGSVGKATVTGAGSTWTSDAALYVGNSGTGTLEILDGGKVSSERGVISNGGDGMVLVDGEGSQWMMGSGDLVVGDASTGRLRIEDGGFVGSGNGATIGHGFVDYDDDAIGSSVEVIGSGSYWANVGGLLVGENSLATLEVLDGGSMQSDSTSLGANPGSEGRVRVNGFDAGGVSSRLDIVGDLLVGDEGTGKLLVDNAGWLRSVTGIIGDTAGSTGSRALVTGTGSIWINADTLSVGKGGEGILEILDGGRVESSFGYIGRNEGSDGKVRVSGVDSAGTRSSWVADGSFYVGDAGSGLLSIEAGGTVDNEYVYIAHGEDSVGEVTVTGVDSSWSVEKNLLVGDHGRGSLSVEAGGMVSGGSSHLGVFAGSVGEATVTGAGSRLMLQRLLEVGFEGSAALLVEAGGQVSNTLGVIGEFGVSSGEVTVTGSGSSWTSSEALTVGKEGSGLLQVLDGGHVESASGSIGSAESADGKVRVSGVDSAGTRSSWEIDAGNLTVGDAGTGSLLIEAGGTVRNQHGFIGNEEGSAGKAVVTGEGSAWISDGGLWVGNAGSGVLEVRDGGVVGSIEGVVGNVGDGTVLVDGAGSRWDIGGTLAVGNLGSGQVTLGNGGVVTSMYGAIGSQGQEHNTVLVQGAGSSWTGMEDLYVGLEGNAALTIADGGRVEVKAGTLDTDVVLGGYGGSTGILNIGAGGAAGVLDAATVTSGEGTAILNFNHDEANYAFTNDGTAGGTAVLIDGTTTVNQIGTGTTVLTGAHTYTGATNINAGTLLVEGSLGNTATNVADGGTLGGSGSIAGAVTVADGGILAPGSSAGTLTVGSLSLSSGSTLDYELGRAGAIGGGVNDLIEVTGNLTLDGTLDITDIGGFGAGVYRLINYGNGLIDNGLEIGVVPDGGDPQDLFVQTAIDGQVNLVNSTGLTLSFWDGSVASEHNNNAVDDGDGSWNAGNDNWTASDGTVNGRWHDGTFAVFGGTAGNVEVVGEQNIAGLQFMSGYTLAARTDGTLRIDGADSVIRVDPNVTATIAAPITGAGGLVKTDTGTLVLSGENSYAGGTRIDLGTLQVASDANLGDVAGGLAFDGGTLQTTAAFDSARSVDLQADGGRLLTDANLGLSGAITGAGTLTKDGAGTLTLTGDNTYTGGTRVLDGTLVGDTGSIRGNLANDGSVIFDQADDDTFSGKIAGTGTMTKDGTGALTLTGNSALDWSIDTGALVAQAKQFGGDASIADGARLRFDEQGDGRYGGTLSGTGAFEVAGDGIFALTGNSAAFAGTTTLESGTLQLGGMLGGSTLVANGAVLTGIGRLGSVDNHGTIAPGNSIGTLTLTGDYIHRDDATLLAEIEPGGDSDLLDIAGKATIEGGTVEVTKAPGQYEGGTRYTLIDAAGGVTGTFGTLDQDLPFLDLLLGYDANRVYLEVQRSEADFDIVCGTGTFNQCQVAGALDAVGHDHPIPDDLKSVLTEVTSLTLPGAQAAFDTLSGEAHGSLAGILLEGHALYGQAVSRRIAERREQTGGERLQGGAWVRAYGSSNDLDGDGNAHAADFEQRGLAIGFDTWGDEHWLIGASFNAMNIDADFRPGDRGEAETKDASLYATFEGEHAYLDVVTSFAWWDNDVTRRIAVGSIEREARSEYGGHRFATHLEAGWTFALGQAQQLTPLVSVEYATLAQEGFREDGADDLDLIGRSQDVERTTVTAGLRWSTAFERGDWTFEPTVQARWLHAFGDEHAEQAMAFAGAPEIGYRVRGVGWPQDRGLLGVGLQLRHGDNLDLFVDVDYQKGGGLESKNLGAGMRWRW